MTRKPAPPEGAARRPEGAARQAVWEVAADSAGIGTWVWRLPSRELVADDRLLQLAGLDRATFAGRAGDLRARIHPDDLAAVTAGVERAVATAGSCSADYRVLDPAGGTRWVAARGRAVVDGTGRVTALVGAAYDTTAVREASARTADVLGSLEVGYLHLDADWRTTHVNAAARRFVRSGPGRDPVGQLLWDLLPATASEADHRRAVHRGGVVVFDVHHPGAPGTWCEVRVAPDAGGLSVCLLDVTARRAAREAAERSGSRLLALGQTALALADAEQVADLVAVVAERGLAALGAQFGAVAVPDPEDAGALLSHAAVGPAPARAARLPVDDSSPVSTAARTGRRVLLSDRADCEALSEQLAVGDAATGCRAWASVPLRAGAQTLGVLTAGWTAPQTFDAEQLELLDGVASQCAQTLQRLRARDAEHAATVAAEHSAAGARRASAQQASLVAVARALGRADAEDDVLAVVADEALGLLGACGSGLCLPEPGGGLRCTATDLVSPEVHAVVQRLPLDFPLPMVHSAVSGARHFLADRTDAVAAFPGAEALYLAAGVQASASVPLRARGRLLGSLVLSFDRARAWPPADQDLVEAFAALVAQALERIGARDAERVAGAEVARFSETLQRSLLTSPPEPDHLHVAVRYVPAAVEAQVGGDWYDAFRTAAGTTSVVIGDVTGHDRTAAAAMGQLRNLLRGIGYAGTQAPAAVLATLDHAVRDLAVDTTATLVLAHIEQTPAQHRTGAQQLRWSSAGHLPPLLIAADGTTSYLEAPSDLMLGIDPGTVRHDHDVLVPPGSTVLLYTDGLVERRGAPLQAGLDWLAATATQLAGAPVDELCDELLALVGDRVEDDVALLALRAHPTAGPERTEELGAPQGAGPSGRRRSR